MFGTVRVLNLIFFIGVIAVNALANILPIGIGNTGQVSARYQSLFTPAPITFFIWGVIYVLLAIFIIYQMGFGGNHDISVQLVKILGPWFIISCIANIGWIFSWHFDGILLSLIFMAALLVSLIVISCTFTANAIASALGGTELPVLIKLAVVTFDLYLGWIIAATVANVSVLMSKIGWENFGASVQFWTVIFILASVLIGVILILTREKYFSSLAIAWAFCGILIRHISQEGYSGKYPLIIAIAIIGIVAILVAGMVKLILRLRVV